MPLLSPWSLFLFFFPSSQHENGKLDSLRIEMGDISTRYHAALELLGEKTEEVEELRNDLQDVKQIFRDQVTELLDKIEQLKGAQQ